MPPRKKTVKPVGISEETKAELERAVLATGYHKQYKAYKRKKHPDGPTK